MLYTKKTKISNLFFCQCQTIISRIGLNIVYRVEYRLPETKTRHFSWKTVWSSNLLWRQEGKVHIQSLLNWRYMWFKISTWGYCYNHKHMIKLYCWQFFIKHFFLLNIYCELFVYLMEKVNFKEHLIEEIIDENPEILSDG